MGCSLPLCLASLLFLSGVAKSAGTSPLFPITSAAPANFTSNGKSIPILLQQPFVYFGKQYSQLYLSTDGFLSFESLSTDGFDPSLNKDIIAPLWTNIDPTGNITIEEAKSGPLLDKATNEMKQMFPDLNFAASWVFVGTWETVKFQNDTGEVTFQVVLISDDEDDVFFVLMNYGNIADDPQSWKAGYQTENDTHEFTILVHSTANLSVSTNVGIPGRWAFRVDATCSTLNCTATEVCVQRTGIYGCGCAGNTPATLDTFDAEKTCTSTSGSISLSRCQLFEEGFSPNFLHLNDPSCEGEVQGDRVVFTFGTQQNICNTTLQTNETHFIYENSVQATFGEGLWNVVSRDRKLKITFSCVYPLIQSISIPMSIHASGSFVTKVLPGTEGTYEISMVPYLDASFTRPSGNVTIEVNQQLFVAVEVDGVDSQQFSTVLDNCWATPDNDMNSNVHWDLITDECPTPKDGTVELLQNGNATSSHFSFRMFTFTGFPDTIFLHCRVHLCLRNSAKCVLPCKGYEPPRRQRRSLDFHDTAAISMGLF